MLLLFGYALNLDVDRIPALIYDQDGTPASIVYNAYGYFDTSDLLKWGSDGGVDERARMRQALLKGEIDESAGKEKTRFGGIVDGVPQIPWESGNSLVSSRGGPWMPGNQGVFIVSLERGDVRMSPDGLYIYDDNGVREMPLSRGSGTGMMPFLASEPLELFNAVRHGKPMLHDARWGMATAEVQWAILESGRQRKEIALKHQVPVPAGF